MRPQRTVSQHLDDDKNNPVDQENKAQEVVVVADGEVLKLLPRLAKLLWVDWNIKLSSPASGPSSLLASSSSLKRRIRRTWGSTNSIIGSGTSRGRGTGGVRSNFDLNAPDDANRLELALCAATILSSLVASPRHRAYWPARLARQCLGPSVAYAIRARDRRNAFLATKMTSGEKLTQQRKQQSKQHQQEQKLEQNQKQQQQDGEKAGGPSSRGSVSVSSVAVGPLDHALVLVHGLLALLKREPRMAKRHDGNHCLLHGQSTHHKGKFSEHGEHDSRDGERKQRHARTSTKMMEAKKLRGKKHSAPRVVGADARDFKDSTDSELARAMGAKSSLSSSPLVSRHEIFEHGNHGNEGGTRDETSEDLVFTPISDDGIPRDIFDASVFKRNKAMATNTTSPLASSGSTSLNAELTTELRDLSRCNLLELIVLLCPFGPNPELNAGASWNGFEGRSNAVLLSADACSVEGRCGDGESPCMSLLPPPSPQQPLSSEADSMGGGGYGAGLSEVEVRCACNSLAMVAAVDGVGVAAALGTLGFARLLALAELNPDDADNDDDDGHDYDHRYDDNSGGMDINDCNTRANYGGNVGAIDNDGDLPRKFSFAKWTGGIKGGHSSRFHDGDNNDDYDGDKNAEMRTETTQEAAVGALASVLASINSDHATKSSSKSKAPTHISAKMSTAALSPATSHGGVKSVAPAPVDTGGAENVDQKVMLDRKKKGGHAVDMLSTREAAMSTVAEFVQVSDAVERVAALMGKIIARARRLTPANRDIATEMPTSAAILATPAMAKAILSQRQQAKLRKKTKRRWAMARLLGTSQLHLCSLALDATSLASNRRLQTKLTPQRHLKFLAATPSPPPPVSTSTSIDAAFSEASNDGSALPAAEKDSGGSIYGTSIKDNNNNNNNNNNSEPCTTNGPLSMVVKAAQAKLLFVRRRLLCVCAMLWSEQCSLATTAAAGIWLLCRDESTRKALATLCVDSQREADMHEAVKQAKLRIQQQLQQQQEGGGERKERGEQRGEDVDISVVEIMGHALGMADTQEAVAAATMIQAAERGRRQRQRQLQGQVQHRRRVGIARAPSSSLPGALLPRLVSCVTGTAHAELRGWALAAVSALLEEPILRGGKGSGKGKGGGTSRLAKSGEKGGDLQKDNVGNSTQYGSRLTPNELQHRAGGDSGDDPVSQCVAPLLNLIYAYGDALNQHVKRQQQQEHRDDRLVDDDDDDESDVSNDDDPNGAPDKSNGGHNDDDKMSGAEEIVCRNAALDKQRLAAVATSTLLRLAYQHAPTLNFLRKLQPPNHACAAVDNNSLIPSQSRTVELEASILGGSASDSGVPNLASPSLSSLSPPPPPLSATRSFDSLESQLLGMVQRSSTCSRLRRHAGHLLWLVVAEDVDSKISGEASRFCCHSADQASNQQQQNQPGVASPPLDHSTSASTPLQILRAAAVRTTKILMTTDAKGSSQSDSDDVSKQGYFSRTFDPSLVLETLFLEVLLRQQKIQQRRQQKNQWQQAEPLDEEREDGEDWNGGDSKPLKFHTTQEAHAFGYGSDDNYGNDNEYQQNSHENVEGDATRFQCLSFLCDLAVRRDKAKAAIVKNGGATAALDILREADNDEDQRGDDHDDEEDGGNDDDVDPQTAETLPKRWKRRLALHLIFNCSATEHSNSNAKTTLCAVTLQALYAATVSDIAPALSPQRHRSRSLQPRSHIHNQLRQNHAPTAETASVVLAMNDHRQLAYSTLFNFGRSPECRAIIYRRALADGLTPPGATSKAKAQLQLQPQPRHNEQQEQQQEQWQQHLNQVHSWMFRSKNRSTDQHHHRLAGAPPLTGTELRTSRPLVASLFPVPPLPCSSPSSTPKVLERESRGATSTTKKSKEKDGLRHLQKLGHAQLKPSSGPHTPSASTITSTSFSTTSYLGKILAEAVSLRNTTSTLQQHSTVPGGKEDLAARTSNGTGGTSRVGTKSMKSLSSLSSASSVSAERRSSGAHVSAGKLARMQCTNVSVENEIAAHHSLATAAANKTHEKRREHPISEAGKLGSSFARRADQRHLRLENEQVVGSEKIEGSGGSIGGKLSGAAVVAVNTHDGRNRGGGLSLPSLGGGGGSGRQGTVIPRQKQPTQQSPKQPKLVAVVASGSNSSSSLGCSNGTDSNKRNAVRQGAVGTVVLVGANPDRDDEAGDDRKDDDDNDDDDDDYVNADSSGLQESRLTEKRHRDRVVLENDGGASLVAAASLALPGAVTTLHRAVLQTNNNDNNNNNNNNREEEEEEEEEASSLWVKKNKKRVAALLSSPSSLLSCNARNFPVGSDSWHPDIVTAGCTEVVADKEAAASRSSVSKPTRGKIEHVRDGPGRGGDGGPSRTKKTNGSSSLQLTLNPPERKGNHFVFGEKKEQQEEKRRERERELHQKLIAGWSPPPSNDLKTLSALPSPGAAAAVAENYDDTGGGEEIGGSNRGVWASATAAAGSGGGSSSSSSSESDKIWMWPHVEGSVYAARAGLTAYNVPFPSNDESESSPSSVSGAGRVRGRRAERRLEPLGSSGRSGDDRGNGGVEEDANLKGPGLFFDYESDDNDGDAIGRVYASESAATAAARDVGDSAGCVPGDEALGGGSGGTGGTGRGGGTSSTVPMFFYSKRSGAPAFPPSLLPCPPAPLHARDVYQRKLPSSSLEEADTDDEGGGGEDEDTQIAVGGWASASAAAGNPEKGGFGSGEGGVLSLWAQPPPGPWDLLLSFSSPSSSSSPLSATPTPRRCGPTFEATEIAFCSSSALVPVAVGGAGVKGSRVVHGGMPPQRMALLVRAPVPKPRPKPKPPAPAAVAGPPWSYRKSSIFVPRGTKAKDLLNKLSYTDAKSMHDSCHDQFGDDGDAGRKKIGEKKTKSEKHKSGISKHRGGHGSDLAFQKDWGYGLQKEERFLNLFRKGAPNDQDPEVAAAKDALRRHYDWLCYMFVIHSASDTNATRASFMNWLCYGALMDLCNVTDEAQRGCKQADLDTIFKAANYEAKAADPDDDNPDLALTRAEWLEVVVRVSKNKFGGLFGSSTPPSASPASTADNAAKPESSKYQVAWCVDELVGLMKRSVAEDAHAREGPWRFEDFRDRWRRSEFYAEATDKVYRRYERQLDHLYRSRVDFLDVGTHKCWELKDWSWCLERHRMFEDDSFTREEGNLSYYLARFTVDDFGGKHNQRFSYLDWLSFLEALGHVVRFKDLPRASDLKEQGYASMAELIRDLDHQGLTFNGYMAEHLSGPGIGEELDEFDVRLDLFLSWLFYEVDMRIASETHTKAGTGDENATD